SRDLNSFPTRRSSDLDISKEKVELYKRGIDPTKEVGDDVIKETTVEFIADETKLKEAKFHIVAVPTPVNADHTPDLKPVESASRDRKSTRLNSSHVSI